MAAGKLNNVDLWASGWTQDGAYYPPEMMRPLVQNFAKFSEGVEPYHPVPLVVGHELDQRLLKSTGLGAAGWLTKLWTRDMPDGAHLFGDFVDVPPVVASWIKARRYRRPSIEFYDSFVDRSGASHGPALARVTLTGAVPPRSKGLADLPLVVFADNPCGIKRIQFTEGNVMDRAAMMAALTEWGVDVSALTDAIPDEAIMAFYNAMMAKMNTEPVVKNTDPPAVPPVVPPTPTPTPAPVPATNQVPAAITVKFAEYDGTLKTLTASVNGLVQAFNGFQTGVRAKADDDDRARVQAFCDQMAGEYRILPHEKESEVLALLAMDDAKKVHTFAENGPKVTARGLKMATIAARPPQRKAGEKMPNNGGAGGGGKGGVSDARQKELLGQTPLGRAALKAREANK